MKIFTRSGNIRTFKFGDKLIRTKPSKNGNKFFMKEIELIVFKKIENERIIYKYYYTYSKGDSLHGIDLNEYEDGWKKVLNR